MDGSRSPCMRYYGPRFAMPLTGLVFLFIGLIELRNPVDYRYPGNLLLLSYIPIAAATLAFVFSAFFWSYRVSIRGDVIEKVIWPIRTLHLPLKDFVTLKETDKSVVIFFTNQRTLKLKALLSGRPHFIDHIKVLTSSSGLTASLHSPGDRATR